MKNQWAVVANRAGAKIFDLRINEKPKLVKNIDHPIGRLESAREINSDRAGRNRSRGAGTSSALEKRTNPVEHYAILFATHLAAELDKARHLRHFDELVLIAEPHFLGKILKVLSAPSKKVLRASIKKDYAEFNDREICAILSEHAELRPMLFEVEEKTARKREHWAKKTFTNSKGVKVGRASQGGGAAKRNKGSAKSRRGIKSANTRA